MQTLLASLIVLLAVAYMAWEWLPVRTKRVLRMRLLPSRNGQVAAHVVVQHGVCGACSTCGACSKGEAR